MKKSLREEYLAYIKDNPKGLWFKRKVYGWGWTPATREGWMVTIVYLAIVLVLAARLDENALFTEALISFVAPAALFTAVFIYIAYKKGEKPKWQWGIEKRDTE